MHEDIDFVYTYRYDEDSFVLSTAQMREILGDVSFQEPEISAYILDYLRENTQEATAGRPI